MVLLNARMEIDSHHGPSHRLYGTHIQEEPPWHRHRDRLLAASKSFR